jgi:hypothetical protein
VNITIEVLKDYFLQPSCPLYQIHEFLHFFCLLTMTFIFFK